MKQRILTLILTLLTLAGYNTAWGETIEVTTQSGLRDAVYNAKKSDVIRLDADINLTTTALEVGNDKTITIDLNNHVLRQTESDNRVILNDGNLTIVDNAQSKTTKYFAFDGETNKWTYTTKSETDYSVTGGVITGGNLPTAKSYSGWGAGILNFGTLTINGGNICGNNTLTSRGGGICNDKRSITDVQPSIELEGKTTINGGTISYNTASLGGGLSNYAVLANMTLLGGVVSHNIASDQGGGLGCDAGCIIGGTAVVMDNICTNDGKGNTTSNLATWVPLEVSNPAEGMNVGVTLTVKSGTIDKGQFTTTCSKSDNTIFFSDCSDYKVSYNTTNGYYELVDKSTPEPSTDPVCKNISKDGQPTYTSIAAAIAAVQTGETIQLIADVTESINPQGTFTLDLNDHVLTAAANSRVILNYAHLTIVDNAQSKTTRYLTKSGNDWVYSGTEQPKKGTLGTDYVSVTGGLLTGGNPPKDGDNVSTGAGIALFGGSLKLLGGNICGNKADCGSGIYVVNDSKLTVGGTAVVKYNTGSNVSPVIYDYQDNRIAIGTGDNAPQAGMQIGMTVVGKGDNPSAGIFTSNGTETDTQYFFADDPNTYLLQYGTDGTNGYLELVEKSTPTGDAVCQILHKEGDPTPYTTLTEAISAVQAKETIQLIADVTESVTIESGIPAFTLDLNDHVLTAAADSRAIVNNGNLTIVDNAADKTTRYLVKIQDHWNLVNEQPEEGEYETLVGGIITGGRISGGQDAFGGGVYNNGTFTLASGIIAGNYADNSGGGLFNQNGATASITGGKITANYSCGVFNLGTMSLTGGTISANLGKQYCGVRNESGNFTVGGSVVISGNSLLDDMEGTPTNLCTTEYITIGTGDYAPNGMSIGITKNGGGQFTTATEDYSSCFTSDDSQYKIEYDSDGKYLKLTGGTPTTDNVCVNTTTGTEYKTLEAAIEAVADKETIQLIADIDLTAAVEISSKTPAFTLDLNDHVLTAAANNKAIVNNGNLTIVDKQGELTIRYFEKTAAGWSLTDDEQETKVAGGCITGGSYTDASGGAIENNGTLTLSSGNICGNNCIDENDNGHGGGVYNTGTFNMTGGCIWFNTSGESGGGVANAEANDEADPKVNPVFNMTGGSICYNTAAFGGGISNLNTITLKNCEISGNEAKVASGVVNMNTCTIGGATYIANNNGGNCVVIKDNTFITLADDATDKMKVGVTVFDFEKEETTSGKFTTECSKSDYSIFFSDDENYSVEYNDDNGYYELTGEVPTGDVCHILHNEGDPTPYTTIAAAIAEVQAGETIQMLRSINLDEPLFIESTTPAFTLDLNGYVLTAAADSRAIYNTGDLTIVDNHDGGKITGGSPTEGNGGGILNEKGNLTILSGTITGNTASLGGGVYNNGGTVTVGGTAKVSGNTNGNLVISTNLTIGTGDNAPAEGMKVYVTKLDGEGASTSGQFSENAAETDAQYFFSDVEDYAVAYNAGTGEGSYLELVTAPDVCMIVETEVGYKSIQSAIEAVKEVEKKDGQTIQMLANTTAAGEIEISGKTFTLDLNGKDVSAADGCRLFLMHSDANMTITDSFKPEKEGEEGGHINGSTIDTNGYDGSIIYNFGTLTINGGIFQNATSNGNGSDGAITNGYGSNFSMTGGVVRYCYSNSGFGGAVVIQEDNNSAIISGGKFYENSSLLGGAIAIEKGDEKTSAATLTISGGEIYDNYTTGELTKFQNMGGAIGNQGDLTITGGNIHDNSAGIAGGIGNQGTLNIGGTVVVSGNTANKAASNLTNAPGCNITIDTPSEGMQVGVTQLNAKFVATSGQFSTNGAETDAQYFFSDVDAYAVAYNAEGYLELKSTTPGEAICQIVHAEGDPTKYETLEAAIKAVESGETIQLLKDINLDATVTVPAGTPAFTLDLDGKVLNQLVEGSVMAISGAEKDKKEDPDNPGQYIEVIGKPSANVTIKDSKYNDDSYPHYLAKSDNTWSISETATASVVYGGVITGGNSVGGAIYNLGTLVIESGNFCGNSSGGDGGAIAHGGANTTTINGGSFCYNYASSKGGAVVGLGSSQELLTITDGEFHHNTAGMFGGAVATSTKISITGGTFSNNTAGQCGGGMALENGATATISGGTFSNNSAYVAGGIGNLSNNTTIGGSLVVTGNKGIQIGKGMYSPDTNFGTTVPVTLGKIGNDMNIGIYLADAKTETYDPMAGPFTTNGTKDDVKYFTSDINTYSVECNKGGYLELVTGTEPVKEGIDVAISQYGKATVYSDQNLIVPKDVIAYGMYYEKNDSIGKLHPCKTIFKEGDILQAGYGYVVQGAEGKYTFEFTNDKAKTVSEDNELKGVLENTICTEIMAGHEKEYDSKTQDLTIYVLNVVDKKLLENADKAKVEEEKEETVYVLGFYRLMDGKAEGEKEGELAANRAYFPLITNKSEKIKLDFIGLSDDDATGIESLSPTFYTREGVYNLSGMRVDENYKGIVIKNGKKYLQK